MTLVVGVPKAPKNLAVPLSRPLREGAVPGTNSKGGILQYRPQSISSLFKEVVASEQNSEPNTTKTRCYSEEYLKLAFFEVLRENSAKFE